MSIVAIQNLGMFYGAQDVFHGVSLAIAHGDKIGLVGPNGEGKTTLLRIILGQLQPTAGDVQRARGLQMAYLPQTPTFDSDCTLYEEMLTVFERLIKQQQRLMGLAEALSESPSNADLLDAYAHAEERFERAGGYTYESRIKRVLGGIGFGEEAFSWPITLLSGGQVTRALLAKLLLQEPDLLVLDEPTNYLDLDALEWLESYLQAWPKSLLIVSHDRYFLDQVVNRIWELEGGTVNTYRGNYSAYLIERAHRRERQRREYREQQELIARAEDFVRRYKAGQRSKQARGREKQLERLERIEAPQERHAMGLRMRSSLRSGDEVLTSDGLVVGYPYPPDGEMGDAPLRLFDTGELRVERGDRIALLGANGCGKTTFLQVLMGEVEPLLGKVRRGASLRIGYLPQTHDWFDPSLTVLEQLMAASKLKRDEALHHLARYLFARDAVEKRIENLSGGERSRLGLAILTLKGANWLILDEPTTHLDVASREVLEQVLAVYNGTLLFVSHDRYLVDAVATHVWIVRQGSLEQFEGSYSAYVQARQEEEGREAKSEAKPDAVSASPRKAQDRRSSQQSVRLTQELEEKIDLLEQRLDGLKAEMAQASADRAVERVRELGQEFTQIESELADRLLEWEQSASAILESE